jgi:hypothetical protein
MSLWLIAAGVYLAINAVGAVLLLYAMGEHEQEAIVE